MKISRSLLIDLAKREAERRGSSGDVISGYIIGSVARNEEPLGGVTDIDLVLIHEHPVPEAREIVRLSDQVHHDITHHHKDLYTKPRELRIHPWMGPALCEPLFIYDPEHFFEWAQAGARGQYYRPDHTYARSKAFLQQARSGATLLPVTGRWVRTYTQALMDAINAFVSLSGFPAAGRRVMQQIAQLSESLGHSNVYGDFLELLGAEFFSTWDLPKTLSAWGKAFDVASEISDEPELHPSRRSYYLEGFQSLIENDQAKTMLWSLLTTWERSMNVVNSREEQQDYHLSWDEFLTNLRLAPRFYRQREERLVAYLDLIETLVDEWGEEHGA